MKSLNLEIPDPFLSLGFRRTLKSGFRTGKSSKEKKYQKSLKD